MERYLAENYQYKKHYRFFLDLCKKDVRTHQTTAFGHIPPQERAMIAQNYCDRMWNINHDRLIPMIDKIFTHKSPVKQYQLEEFLVKPDHS